MGYSTEFTGRFDLDKPLKAEHKAYLQKFSGTRRMERDDKKTATRPDPIREAVGLPAGPDGCYFVGESGFRGQDTSFDLLDYNKCPLGQPSLWCDWVPTEDGHGIEWDGREKFYHYVEWIEYLIEHFLEPWGYILNGEVKWQGESMEDRGKIVITDNHVETVDLE